MQPRKIHIFANDERLQNSLFRRTNAERFRFLGLDPMQLRGSERLATQVSVRTFEPRRDQIKCRQIYASVRPATFSWVNPKRFKESDFAPDIVGETLLVADDAVNGVVGFIGIWMPENFIHHLYVLPEFHRVGIGRALLEAALRIVSRPAKLKCQMANRNACQFYRHLGWREGEQGLDEIGRWVEFILD